ncbi:MAG: hypothetical protein ABIK89_17395 [Planctomycetota bacterium]
MTTLDFDDDKQLESAFAEALELFAPPAGLKETVHDRLFGQTAGPSAFRRPWAVRRGTRRLVVGLVAASLLLAASVWLTRPGTVLVSVSYAELAEILQNSDQAEWVHYFEKDGREMWMSFRPYRFYSKSGSDVFAMDRSKNRKYRYDAAKGMLTVSYMGKPGGHSPEFCANLSEWMREFMRMKIEDLEHAGSEVRRGVETVHGKIMTVFVVTVFRDGEEEGTLKYYIDPETDRVVQIEGFGAGVLSWRKERVVFDYPAQGPQSVHDLGVPRDAKIIDETPPPEVLDLVRKVERAAETRPKQFYHVSVQVYESFSEEYPPFNGVTVNVIYSKDGQKRRDEYCERCPRPMTRQQAQQYLDRLRKEIPVDRLEAMEAWLSDHKPERICLTDVQNGRGTIFRLDEEGKLATEPIPQVMIAGWDWDLDGKPSLLTDQQGPWGKLVGIENHDSALKLHRSYFNPDRDYLWEKTEKLVGGAVSRRNEVVEYGKTPAGWWFRKRLRKTEYNGRDTILETNFRDDRRAIGPWVFDGSRITAENLSQP